MGNILRSLWSFVWGGRFTTSEEVADPSTESSPSGVKQISQSVYLLYSPEGEPEDWDVEIIFFHGLSVDDVQNAWWKTWHSIDGKVLWPKDWLKLQCQTARTLAVTYNSRATLKEGDPIGQDMYNLGRNLVLDIICDAGCGQKTARPVILVGHCLGGIMIKQFIISACNLKAGLPDQDVNALKISKFLSNFEGVFFYGTPNGGSPLIENWAKKQENPGPLLELMKVLGTDTQRINQGFQRMRQNKIQGINARAQAIFESRPTNTSEFHGLIVPEASARQDCDIAYTSERDHFAVCKASSEKDFTVIGKLARFTQDILSEALPNLEEQRKLEAKDRELEAQRKLEAMEDERVRKDLQALEALPTDQNLGGDQDMNDRLKELQRFSAQSRQDFSLPTTSSSVSNSKESVAIPELSK